MKNNFKSHSKYKHTKQGNFIKIFKGSIVILNDKEGMCNFKTLRELNEIVKTSREVSEIFPKYIFDDYGFQ